VGSAPFKIVVVAAFGGMMRPAIATDPSSPGRPTTRQNEWLSERVAVHWQGIAAADALADLANRIGKPIWTSDLARQRVRETPLTMTARHLTGLGALNVVCRLVGLNWTLVDGVVAISDVRETPSAWKLVGEAIRSAVDGSRPGWSKPIVEHTTADLDLVDVSIATAVEQIAEAYGLSLWVSDDVRSRQELITLKGEAVPMTVAITTLEERLQVRALESDGVIWLVPADAAGSFQQPANTAPPAERPTTGTHVSQGNEWVRLNNGAVAAEGWEQDVYAAQEWIAHRGTIAGKATAPGGEKSR
jgi:hypothetical protein